MWCGFGITQWAVGKTNNSNKSDETQSSGKKVLTLWDTGEIVSIGIECITWRTYLCFWYIYMKTHVSFSKKERADLTDVCVKSSQWKFAMQKDLWKISVRLDKEIKKGWKRFFYGSPDCDVEDVASNRGGDCHVPEAFPCDDDGGDKVGDGGARS